MVISRNYSSSSLPSSREYKNAPELIEITPSGIVIELRLEVLLPQHIRILLMITKSFVARMFSNHGVPLKTDLSIWVMFFEILTEVRLEHSSKADEEIKVTLSGILMEVSL